MATTEHKGNLVQGDIVMYKGSFGTSYGYELVKEIYLSATGDYHWIGRSVKLLDGENKPKNISADATKLEILTEKDVTEGYPLKWTKDPEFKKGDILVGLDKKSNKKMLFVYLSDQHVERLTPRSDMMMPDQFGYSTLSDYAGNFGPLTVHTTQGYTTAGNNTRFSAL